MINKKKIIIVGAGASGSAAAWNLSKISNYEVICLEQGEEDNPKEYDYLSNEWEKNKLYKYHKNPNLRKSLSDYPIDNKDSQISIANYNGVGGSSIIYNAHLPRFRESDFKIKKLDGIGMDWPLNYNDLKKYFELNEKRMGLAGKKNDPAYPQIKNLLPPVKLGKSGELILKTFKNLKWHCWPSYSGIATKKIKNRKILSKANAINSYLKDALKNGIKLKTNCRVIKIKTNNKGKVSGLYYSEKGDKTKFLDASIIILACSGVGTPRLLLNSKNKKYTNGLANTSGQIGKNLMLHPLGYAEGSFKKFLASHVGPEGCCVYSHQFYNSNKLNKFKRGYTIQVLRGQSAVDTALNEKKFDNLKFGEKFHDIFFYNYGHTIPMAIICEDLPDKKNYLELNYKKKDSDGMPGIKVNYSISENTKRMLAHGISMCRIALKKAGATRIRSFGPVRDTGWHIMGTARMGSNKKNSVVNPFGQSHDIENLFIVDSSIFVSSAAVNPLNTMTALSLRITDFIKKNISRF